MRSRVGTLRFTIVCLLGAAFVAMSAGTALAGDKIVVKSLDDLPRHTYKIPGTATELLQSDQQSADLAKQVRADIEGDLEKCQIEDATTLKRLYGVLLNLDMLDGSYDAALKHVVRLRDLEEKQAAKLMTGLTTEAYIAARQMAGDRDEEFRALFKLHLLSKLHGLPWDVVGDEIESRKGMSEIISESLVMGMIQSSVDPVVAKTNGEISADIAQSLVNRRALLKNILPLKNELVEVYTAIVNQSRVAKPDIWAARDVTLSPDQQLKPVVVAIWDSGIDANIFKDRLFVNPGEEPDGKDDDGNGFVDDVHGIAYDIDSNPVTALLHPLDGLNAKAEEVAKHMKGFMDLQAAVESPEAVATRRMLSELKPNEVQAFIEDLGLFGNYAHGTHVTGIAAAGNPYIRILAARITFDYHVIPKCPTIELAHKIDAAQRATIEYFKQHDVRVVNMSWGESRSSIESALEQNAVGGSAEERAELSRKIFKIVRDSLYEAIKGAPEILFVTSAGNADNDVEFDEMIPSGFDLPNLMVIGAVDQAGDPTDFTSFGRTVHVYASGFEVDSYIPGGQRMKFSGTSMSSPNVVNLAAKLLALDPSLKPTQLTELIKKGADKSEHEKPMLLINPRTTLALLKK